MKSLTAQCPLCQRTLALTFHHLIPRKVHRRSHFAKRYNRDELNRGINICRGCHTAIHRTFDEMTLAKEFNSLDALLASPEIQRYIAWASKQKASANP
ncbi:hypothetical protein [Neptuniibacter sp.]|uniref:hypothetical protein n=1 Tax=Neptuniibacter sp. TaxID=1962643 RepID=UPI002632773A|nr:hypothetical protein [Neptuniibacter sp.]MCP4598576.1 hypothetical protein [Neptuniibacter sp.]